MIRRLLPAALLAAMIAPAFAATPIDQTRPLDPHGRIEVSNVQGRIQIRAWDRNEVHLTGSLGDGVEKLVFEGDRDSIEIKPQYPRNSRHAGPTTLILSVPLQASLEVDSVAADVDIAGVAPDDLSIDSVSGNIAFAGAPKQADINSVSGRQALAINSAGEVKVESVSGGIGLRGRLSNAVHAETVSGNLRVDTLGNALKELTTSTVSGDADISTSLASGGRIKGETVSGDIRLALSGTTSAHYSAESFSGDLAAPNAQVKKERFGPGSSIDTSYGGGSGEIRLETFSGDATLTFH